MICNFSVHSAGISDNLLKNFSINCKLVITYSRRKISFTMKKKYSIASLILTAALVIVCSYIGVRLYNDHRQNSTSREVEADIARAESRAADGSRPSDGITDSKSTRDSESGKVSRVDSADGSRADRSAEIAAQDPLPSQCAAVTEAQKEWPDIVGILEAGKDTVEYVVQGSDNDFYLGHNYKGESSGAGAAFLDARASLSPRSKNLIIHGHNMRNDAVFGGLDNYSSPDYLKSNPLIYFYTETEKQVYVPFAVTDVNVDPEADDYFKITEWNFDTDQAFLDYAGYYKNNSLYDIPTDVKADDELLLLSTCSYTHDDSRQILCCRKLRADETEESVTQMILTVG